ncbi:hypothetical protein LB467_00045 [Salegentibacter sp. JZCK2]|uniref:hypothetical protein n=1 Tax=Salegentibacter tibetensis TaxID=2873600 RepID=UPI001CC8F9B5|nr:hypothetical protein [Salegentibacter tibetensis]MBZ9728068.1 hypothetical protein [Salegentibacter tibetensis]
MKNFKIVFPLIALFFCFNILSAQEMTAEKHENLKWYTITYFDFHDGKIDEAMKLVNEYFKPTDQDLGEDVMDFELLYNEWDHMVIFPMKEGLEVFEWKTSPHEIEWMKALEKHAGSKEKVKEIMEEWESYVKKSKSHLARTKS